MANHQQPESDGKTGLGILQIVQGVLAAMFGVRDHRKYQRDFEQGDLAQFFAVGIVFVALFVISLIWIVDIILSQ